LNTYHHYLDLRDATRPLFSGLAGFRYETEAVRIDATAESVSSAYVSANYFQVLGVKPALGRLFSDTTERLGSAEPELVVGYGFWKGRLAGDSAVIGRTLYVDSRAMTVVGVAPPGFAGTIVGLVADIWIPDGAAAKPKAGSVTLADSARDAGPLTVFGRLRDAVSARQAVAALDVIGPAMKMDAPWQHIKSVALDPMVGPPAMFRGAVIGFFGMLLVTAGLVLCIAAANIAGMLLVRAAHRRREVAVRLALGAGRGRLMRQLLTESAALCAIGGVAGVLLARVLVTLIPSIQAPTGTSVALNVRLDPVVLVVSLAITIAAGIAAGLAPALQAARVDLVSGLHGLPALTGRRTGRSRSAFVIAQLAMSLVLLISAGLFTRAFRRALLIDPGLDARNVVVARLDVGAHGYDQARGAAFYTQLAARLAARPEVAAVAFGEFTPLAFSHWGQGILGPDGNHVPVTMGLVDANYLSTVRVPIVSGRGFLTTDTPASEPVVVVNETLARRLWPGEPALGQQLKLANGARVVVGVVRDGKYRSLDESPAAYAFLPFAQSYNSSMTVHVRARDHMDAVLAALRTEVAALDPNIAVERPRALATDLDLYFLPQRTAAWVIGVFGLVGLALAGVGIYGSVAYDVARRTREMGIRLALGARGSDLVMSVLSRGGAVVGVGIAIGLPVALVVARLATGFLYGIRVFDPLTFVAAPAALGVIALGVSYIPARRAALVDPAISLRVE
ncbi:MAG: ADOP family duplicated permease, partial [Gemmatimonadales bacterium]